MINPNPTPEGEDPLLAGDDWFMGNLEQWGEDSGVTGADRISEIDFIDSSSYSFYYKGTFEQNKPKRGEFKWFNYTNNATPAHAQIIFNIKADVNTAYEYILPANDWDYSKYKFNQGACKQFHMNRWNLKVEPMHRGGGVKPIEGRYQPPSGFPVNRLAWPSNDYNAIVFLVGAFPLANYQEDTCNDDGKCGNCGNCCAGAYLLIEMYSEENVAPPNPENYETYAYSNITATTVQSKYAGEIDMSIAGISTHAKTSLGNSTTNYTNRYGISFDKEGEPIAVLPKTDSFDDNYGLFNVFNRALHNINILRRAPSDGFGDYNKDGKGGIGFEMSSQTCAPIVLDPVSGNYGFILANENYLVDGRHYGGGTSNNPYANINVYRSYANLSS